MGHGKKKMYKVINGLEGTNLDQEELLKVFGALSGDSSKLDPELIRDKYNRLKNAIQRCNKLILKFKEAILDKLHTKIGVDPYFDQEVKQLVTFVNNANDYIDEEISEEHFINYYQNLKESFIIEEYLKVCKVLTKNEECLKNKDNLSDAFIKNSVGEEFYIFDFAKINFKHLFSHILSENFSGKDELTNSKKYILLSLNMLYITTQDIYQLISSPDVDIDKLSEVIVAAIEAAKKQIPRCDRAFKIIGNSVDMLKSNMNTYYKDFVATSNPTIIFESFISDIANDVNMDSQTLNQFKRIIFHFRKKSESMPKNSKLDTMFTSLDKIMSIMENNDSKEE